MLASLYECGFGLPLHPFVRWLLFYYKRRFVEGAYVWATKSLEIIEGSLASTVEATMIPRASIVQELLPFGAVCLVPL